MDYKFTLTWDKLKVWVTEKTKNFFLNTTVKKIILNEASGQIKNNTLVAILGASGSGKTTLLAALACKIKNKTGIVKINNKIVDENDLNDIIGFLYQDEMFSQFLTINEYIKFVSALKLYNTNQQEIDDINNKVISELNLEFLRDTVIKNLSGGEKRRLALAAELLNNPTILYCDEPTTGLDSFSANLIVKKLQNIAMNGKLVITTIHQPSSELFKYFNHIILLSSGKLIFQGNKSKLLKAFTRENLVCPELYNPAEFYIKCITVRNINENATLELLKRLNEKYNILKNVNNGSNGYIFKKTCEKPTLNYELYWLLWRSINETKRNIKHHLIHFSILMTTATILTTSYSSVKMDDENSPQNISGLLFFIVSELIFTHMYAVIYTFPSECAVSIREKTLYSAFSHFLSKVILFIPRNIIQPLMFLLIISFSINFGGGIKLFMNFFLILSIACVTGSTFGLCLSSIFNSLEYIELFIVPFDLVTMLMAGVWINIKTLPVYLIWMKYLSPFYYTYESLSILYWSQITNIDCSKNKGNCYFNGTNVLEAYGFHQNESEVLWNIFYSIVLSITFCIIGYIGILKNRIMYNL